MIYLNVFIIILQLTITLSLSERKQLKLLYCIFPPDYFDIIKVRMLQLGLDLS